MDRICYNCMWEKRSENLPCEHCGFDNASYQVPEGHLRPMTMLAGKYLIGRSIGSGGFGITYIAQDTHLRMTVAVKELFPREIARRTQSNQHVEVSEADQGVFNACQDQFLQEARVLAMFHEKDDEGIVAVRDHFCELGTAYLVMEYLQGVTLRERVVRQGKMPRPQIRSLLLPVMRTLIKIHQFGIVHQDVSPENIMLLDDGRVKLLDFGGFGLSCGKGQSRIGSVKDGYAAPEQYEIGGNCGPWTDVYGMAATIRFCLTGRPPGEAWKGETSGRHFPGLNYSGMEKILNKGMAENIRDRYSSMEEFELAIRKSTGMPGPGAIGAGLMLAFAMFFLILTPGKISGQQGEEADGEMPETQTEAAYTYALGDLITVREGVYHISLADKAGVNWALSRQDQGIILWPQVWDDYACFYISEDEGHPGEYRIFPLAGEGLCLEQKEEGEIAAGSTGEERGSAQHFRFRYVTDDCCLIQCADETVIGYTAASEEELQGVSLHAAAYDAFPTPEQVQWQLLLVTGV